MVRGLLTAWADEDDRISASRQDAKEQVFVKFARQRFLNALGSNVGVFRPAAINLLDEQYRELIPALSWFPKQVEPTMQAVLDVFFGVGNPVVSINQVNPNEIVIQIPSSVPALRRDLRGANHFKTYDGPILSIDNIFKEMVVDIDGTVTSAEPKHLVVDQNTTLFTDTSSPGNDLFAFEINSTGTGLLNSISLAFNRAGALPISGAFKLELRSDASGEPSTEVLSETAEISIPDLPQNPDGNLVPYLFETPVELEDGVTYWVVINMTENLSAGSFLAIEDDSSLGYSGLWLNSTDGSTWVAGGGSSTFVNQLAQTAAAVFFDSLDLVGEKKAQQFTANSTGDISAVKVGLINNGSTTGQIKLSIQADNGSNNPDGVDLASTNVDFTSFIGGATIDLYSLTGSASVVSGQKYWIVFELTQVPNNSSNIRYSSGNPLSEFYSFNTGSWVLNNSIDLTFEVEIVQPPAGPTLSPYFDSSITAENGDKILKEKEWAGAKFGQGFNTLEIIGNTAGPGPITVQFSAGTDLSVYSPPVLVVEAVGPGMTGGTQIAVITTTTYRAGQGFIPSVSGSLSDITFNLHASTSAITGNGVVRVYGDNGSNEPDLGNLIGTSAFLDMSTMGLGAGNKTLMTFIFTSGSVVGGTKYHAILSGENLTFGTSQVVFDTGVGDVIPGNLVFSTDSGANWIPLGTTDAYIVVNLNLAAASSNRYIVANATSYQGAFIPDTTRPYTVTQQRGLLGQALTIGSIYPVIIMDDASGIPDTPGVVTLDFGGNQEEGPIRYFGRPNNTTLLLDPSYNFTKDHSIGEAVNVVVTPYQVPRKNGFDYSTYIVGVTAARELAQQIVESVTASGVVVRWIVVEPECRK
jgi:hypothetical protein